MNEGLASYSKETLKENLSSHNNLGELHGLSSQLHRLEGSGKTERTHVNNNNSLNPLNYFPRIESMWNVNAIERKRQLVATYICVKGCHLPLTVLF